MNCGVVEGWLDEGMPGRGAAAKAHAARCALCGPRVDAAKRVEARLAEPWARAPAAFSDGVLARIEGETQLERIAARTSVGDTSGRRLPWWIWVGADPAFPLALAAGSVLLGLGQAGLALAQHPIGFTLPAPDIGRSLAVVAGSPAGLTALAVGLLPLVLLFSYFLYLSTQGVVRTRVLRR